MAVLPEIIDLEHEWCGRRTFSSAFEQQVSIGTERESNIIRTIEIAVLLFMAVNDNFGMA